MEIEKSVPMPESYSGPGNVKHTQFREMDVGDSIFIEAQGSAGIAATAARVYGHRSGKKFASRSCEGGVRIWRTA